jgi:hypothetical protein
VEAPGSKPKAACPAQAGAPDPHEHVKNPTVRNVVVCLVEKIAGHGKPVRISEAQFEAAKNLQIKSRYENGDTIVWVEELPS